MDESTIRSAINTSYWISGACGFLLLVNGSLMIYLATKVSSLSKGIDKFFQWFDNRQCVRHDVLIAEIDKEVDNLKQEIAELKRNKLDKGQ
jgi:hypothetical protein